jgi:predicted amidohydrolase
VVLPEFFFRSKKGHAHDAVDLETNPLMESLRSLARENNINLIFHVLEWVEPNIYGTAIVINREGEYVGKYRKVNLPPEESDLTPGDSYEIFDLDFGKIGILICWDGWFTEPARILVEKGAEMIIIPTWCNCRPNLNTIAAENGVPMAYAVLKINCGSGDDNLPSSVFDPHGDAVYIDHMVGGNKLAIGRVRLGGYGNVALNKPVKSSPGSLSEFPAEYAIDGRYSTERDAPPERQTTWKAESLPQWIEIDLGTGYTIDRVSIAQFNTENYHYHIEGKVSGQDYEFLSDSVTRHETELEHGIAGSEILSSEFEPRMVRYLKLTIDSETEPDLEINEIKVFGHLDN